MSLAVKVFNGDSGAWDEVIAQLPQAHALQTWEWGEVKSQFGWEPNYLTWEDPFGRIAAAALVLMKAISFRGHKSQFNVMYVPKGPLLDWVDREVRREVLSALASFACARNSILIKIDPDVRMGQGIPGQPEAVEFPDGQSVSLDLTQLGWRFSSEQIQFKNTVILDISGDADGILARMKQKTRYNIRLAEKKGISIRIAEIKDLDLLFKMYAETADRDRFVIRNETYYKLLWETFMKAELAEGMIAELEGEPIAGLIYFYFAGRAWYMSGMSASAHREKMPNHLLQWRAICRLKELGVRDYDLWGAPDNFIESDPLWGVYRFKEGFNGQVVRHLGAWDLPIRSGFYSLYTRFLPTLLNIMRRQGIRETHRMVGLQG